ncbi:uncharacterized protein K441DRAFT_571034 [Cenococcum geophilum 1.58]|uniref:uncharacterized protein n=1 Tax=Cenococcum geophilum 1.58 TaxID=794803 RepID=UPI00358E1765|nr:hypothetical protein K441DRAFT_571034 [Cenococcum geophilum 1.58]
MFSIDLNSRELDMELDTELDAELDIKLDAELDIELDIELDTELDIELDAGLDIELDFKAKEILKDIAKLEEEGPAKLNYTSYTKKL